MTLTTTLNWRGNALYAGEIYVGLCSRVATGGWVAHLRNAAWQTDPHPDKEAARLALETAARKALGGGT